LETAVSSENPVNLIKSTINEFTDLVLQFYLFVLFNNDSVEFSEVIVDNLVDFLKLARINAYYMASYSTWMKQNADSVLVPEGIAVEDLSVFKSPARVLRAKLPSRFLVDV